MISRRGAVAGVVGASIVGTGLASGASAATPKPATKPVSKPASAPTTMTGLKVGSRGAAVTALQNRLNALGYWCGTADGAFGAQTQQAVYAIQKVAGLSRDGIVGPATNGALSRGARPASRRGGNRMEVDKSRQIAMVVRGGQVKYIFNTSTGSGQHFQYYGQTLTAVTPSGEFKISRHGSNGWDYGALGGLWRPYYFNGGIAFHGAAEIPPYPASHGCCRLSCSAQDFLISSNILYIGESVSVY